MPARKPNLDQAIAAAARAISVYDWNHGLSGNDHPSGHQRAEAEAAVRAAAPLLIAKARQQAADEILAHADQHAPLSGEDPSALRRHLHIAARVAAGMPTPEQAAAALTELRATTHTEHTGED